jgi:LacI family transcriptional regulator
VHQERPGPATLSDVAGLAGVHTSTASRALNERTRGRVSSSTVDAVLEAARELNYRPNSLARGLKLSRTFTVGMLIPDLTNPLFPPIVRGIEDRLRDSGWTLVLANTDNDDEKERILLDSMTARRVDGLILATARRQYPLLEEVSAAGLPTVLVNRTTDQPTVPAVLGDDQSGIGQAVRHLVGLGHTRIGLLGGTQTVSTGLARYHAFISWMHSEGLEVDPSLIAFARWFREDQGAEVFEAMLDRGADPTAIICGNDMIALGVYHVMRERGLRCPEDISVIGYNDTTFNDSLSPPLTSVRIAHYQIGFRAADLLLDAIENPEIPPADIQIKPELVVRGSTAAPRRSPLPERGTA